MVDFKEFFFPKFQELVFKQLVFKDTNNAKDNK